VAPQAMRNVDERNALVLKELPLAFLAVRRRQGAVRRRLEVDDAVQEACLGLLTAAARWQPTLGAFSSLAMVCCRQHMAQAAEQASLVRVPRYHHYPNEHSQESCERYAEQARQALAQAVSWEALTFADDTPGVPSSPSPFATVAQRDESRYLQGLLTRLPLLCQVILRLRFWDGLTRPAVCQRLGLTKGVEARLERETLAWLYRALGKDYLDAHR
jgi:RNA polymerase sigma factor (sigma-70 family)